MRKHRYILILLFLVFAQITFGQEVRNFENKFKFFENKGQWPDFVHFRASSRTAKMYIEEGRILYEFLNTDAMHEAHYSGKEEESMDESPVIERELIAANFIGANKVRETQVKNPSKEYYNFFIGNDKDKWASKVYGYSDVVLNEYYDGIDLHFNNEGDHLKYEFIVKENANPNEIVINYENAKSVQVTEIGNLRIEGELGIIEEKKPYVYQIKNGKILEISCEFEVDGNNVTYDLGEYDRRVELVIDPDLIFASYSGSLSDNFGMTATYDNEGNLYSGGTVFGNSYPTTAGSYDENGNFTNLMPAANDPAGTYGVTDIFISKYSSDGKTLLFSTYLGGGGDIGGTEIVHSIICNDNNELYYFGTTSSSDFPLVNPYQATFNGGLYREFTSNGAHFFGSDGTQGNGGTDLIIGKFSSDGSDLLGSTYLGGSANDGLNYNETGGINGNVYGRLMFNYGDPFRGEIMLDDDGNCYVASSTYSNDFPVVNAIQPALAGAQDGVLFKFDADLNNLIWSTYWGGQGHDACYAIKFDTNNDVYAVGGTVSDDFPTTPGVIQEFSDSTFLADGFVSRFSSDMTTLIHSTYIATEEYDQVYFLQINRNDEVFLLGQTQGEIIPSPDTYNNPNSGQFIMQIENDLSAINIQTVFGNGDPGQVNISPSAFLVDICGNIYVSGWGGGIAGSLHQTSPLDSMPVTSDAYQSGNGDGYNFYLIVLSSEAKDLIYASYLGGGSAREHVDGGTSRFDSDGIVYQSVCGGCGGNSDFPTFPSDVWSTTNNSNNCNNLVFKFNFNLIPVAEFYVDSTVGCAPFEVTFNNSSTGEDSFLWDFGDGNVDSTTFEPTVTYSTPGTYDVSFLVTDSTCLITDTAFITIEVTPQVQLENIPQVDLCEPDTVTLTVNSFGTADEFIWSTNSNFSDTLNDNLEDSTFNFYASNSGYYYVMVQNDGCLLVDSVLVLVASSALELNGDTGICLGEETLITASSESSYISFTNYNWSDDSIIVSGDGSNQVVVNPTISQYVYLIVESSNGCIISDSILVEVSDIDTSLVNAYASDDSAPVGGTVTLTAEPGGGFFYSWFPPGNLTDPNSQTTDAMLTETTTYFVEVSDGICAKTAQVTVKVYGFICEEPFVYVPNAFTPNGDGENDIMFVRSSVVEELVFRIYNRWGELVFETTDINQGWDGTFKGKLSDPDVYDYYLEGFCIDGQEFLIQGNITLIR